MRDVKNKQFDPFAAPEPLVVEEMADATEARRKMKEMADANATVVEEDQRPIRRCPYCNGTHPPYGDRED